MCGAPSTCIAANSAARADARAHPLVVGPRLVFEAQRDVRVAGARSDEIGEDPHYVPPSVR